MVGITTTTITTNYIVPGSSQSISRFAYRLSFDSLTDHSLRTVMAVLDTEMDTDIDTILRPLVPSPAMGPIVFGKDPTTRVVVVDDMGDKNRNEVVLDVDVDNNTYYYQPTTTTTTVAAAAAATQQNNNRKKTTTTTQNNKYIAKMTTATSLHSRTILLRTTWRRRTRGSGHHHQSNHHQRQWQ